MADKAAPMPTSPSIQITPKAASTTRSAMTAMVGAGKGRERGADFEQARAHDDDREEGRHKRKAGNTPRPHGEP